MGTVIFNSQVSGVKRFWQWVDTGMLPNLYAGKMYTGQVDPQQEGYFGDRQSFILGKVVMRQVRVKPGKSIERFCKRANTDTDTDMITYPFTSAACWILFRKI